MNLSKYEKYTIAFEIELECDDNFINIPQNFYTMLKPFGKQEDSEEKRIIEEKRAYAKEKIKSNLPNFYKKYNDKLNYTFDKTLNNGIEIVNKKYCNGISESIEMLTDFFNDLINKIFGKWLKIHQYKLILV